MAELNVDHAPVDILEMGVNANLEFHAGKDHATKGSNVMTPWMDSNAVHVLLDIMEMVNGVKDEEAVKVAHATQVRDSF
jgi:hypothetical protein